MVPPTCSVREQRIKILKLLVCLGYSDGDITIFKIHLELKLRHPHKNKFWPRYHKLSLKCRVSTTPTVQFAVNYVPQCFKANAPYSVLSRFIIIKSMAAAQTLCSPDTYHSLWLGELTVIALAVSSLYPTILS